MSKETFSAGLGSSENIIIPLGSFAGCSSFACGRSLYNNLSNKQAIRFQFP